MDVRLILKKCAFFSKGIVLNSPVDGCEAKIGNCLYKLNDFLIMYSQGCIVV